MIQFIIRKFKSAILSAAGFILTVLLTGCDAFQPYEPAMYGREVWAMPTPHIGVPRPGLDDALPWPYDGFTAGPFYQNVNTYNGGEIVSALGPAFRYERRPDTTRRIYVPLLLTYGEHVNPLTGHTDAKGRFLWPLGHFSDTYRETQAALYPVVWVKRKIYPSADLDRARTKTDLKIIAFPISGILPMPQYTIALIQLHWDSKEGASGGLFPIGGVFHNLLGRERVVMYAPFVGKFEGGGFTSWFYPWPLIGHWSGHDNTRHGWQFWPIYKVDNYEHKWHKRSVLILWNEYHSQLDTSQPMRSYALFPFFISRTSPTRVQYTILWPLFHYYERKQANPAKPVIYIVPRKEYTFWPVFHYATGKDVFALTLWPLFKYRSTPLLSYVTTGPGREIFFPIGFAINMLRGDFWQNGVFYGNELFEMHNVGDRLIPGGPPIYEWERIIYRDYIQTTHRWLLFAYYRVRSWHERNSGEDVVRRSEVPAEKSPEEPSILGSMALARSEGFAPLPGEENRRWKQASDAQCLCWPLWRYDRTASGAWRFSTLAPVFIADPGEAIQSHYGFLWQLFALESAYNGDKRMRALFGSIRADWATGYLHHGFYPLYDWWSLSSRNDRLLFSLGEGILYRHYRSPSAIETGNVVFRYREEKWQQMTGTGDEIKQLGTVSGDEEMGDGMGIDRS